MIVKQLIKLFAYAVYAMALIPATMGIGLALLPYALGAHVTTWFIVFEEELD